MSENYIHKALWLENPPARNQKYVVDLEISSRLNESAHPIQQTLNEHLMYTLICVYLGLI
jgi:hypothetical protein